MKSISVMVLLIALSTTVASAKRAAPAEVPPVTHQGIEYRAPSGFVAKMGVVEAWDKATGKMLWEKRAYSVKIDPKLESDVQHVFISKLEIKDGQLIITTEHHERYSLDLKTQEVKKLPSGDNEAAK